MENGYREVFWKIVPIISTIIIALVSVVWGISYIELSRRINRIDDIVLRQSESSARIEAKLDVLLKSNMKQWKIEE